MTNSYSTGENKMFCCDRCGYATDVKCNYSTHIKRKKPCLPTLHDVSLAILQERFEAENKKVMKYTCSVCNRDYASRAGLSYHTKISHPQTVDHMEQHIKRLEEELQEIKSKQNTGFTITNNGDHNTTNINFIINAFGQEYKEHITLDFALKCLQLGGQFGVEKMMDKIYFDKEHPENHNVRLVSLKNQFAEVYKGQGWETNDLNATIDRMISQSGSEIINRVSPIIISEPTEDNFLSMQTISNLEPRQKKSLKDRTKGKLQNRRKIQLSS